MVKVIMGLKGEGKTKTLIDLVKKALDDDNGDVVCIEKDGELTYDIPHRARLIKLSQYNVYSYEFLSGFICGLHSGNYDITDVFMDNLFKLAGTDSANEVESFLDWLDGFSDREGIKFTITISGDAEYASDGVKKFF